MLKFALTLFKYVSELSNHNQFVHLYANVPHKLKAKKV